MRFRDRIIRFMYGRYGKDELRSFLTVIFYIIFILSLFIKSYIAVILMTAIMALIFFRSLSRNIAARRRENNAYLKLRDPIKRFFKLQKNKIKDRKTHIFRRCPECRTVLRLPRTGKGTHPVKCPKCGKHFEIKIKK